MKLRKYIGLVFILLLLFVVGVDFSFAENYERDFLATAVSVNLSTTSDTSSTTRTISIPDEVIFIGITVTFTRTTGSAEEVDFKFQFSYDNGTTWTTDDAETITLSTNVVAVSNVVNHYEVVLCPGVTHAKMVEIDNRDSTINLTVCNATLSWTR